MSHRAEEKERRRQERLAAEQAAKNTADRRKRLGIVGGVVLAIAVIAIVVVATGVVGGDEGGNAAENPGSNASVPAQRIDNLAEAARAAGCTVTEHRIEGRGHTGETVRYRTNPPTSGDHDPTPAEDGVYPADGPPDIEQSVHSLEHGRILIQYKAGTPAAQVAQLEAVAGEEVKGTPGYHTLVFQNQTDMKPAVAVTAWGRSLTCDTFNDKIFDAIRAFRRDRVDKGPEFVP
jgi:hypothetical protein